MQTETCAGIYCELLIMYSQSALNDACSSVIMKIHILHCNLAKHLIPK